MGTMLASLVAATVLGCGGTPPAAPVSVVATPAPSIADPTAAPVDPMARLSSSAPCRPTLPNGMTPPGEDKNTAVHGEGGLFTNLWPNGEILADPRFVEPDGSIGMKFWWWRAPGVGKAGDLVITGHEITTGAAIRADIPDGYGQRFQATGLSFPTEGCYEVVGRSGTAELRFVTRVVKVTKVPAPPE